MTTVEAVYQRTLIHAAKPSVWVEDVLDFHPDVKQREVLDSTAVDTLLLHSRQTGKTETIAALVAHHVMHIDGALALLSSATQRQAGIMQRRVTHDLRIATGDPHIGDLWKRGKTIEVPEEDVFGNVRMVTCSVLSLELSNGSQVVSVPCHPDTIRGYSPTFVAVDEAARVRDDAFYALLPMRAARIVPMILMSTAGVEDGFYYKAWTGKDQDYFRSEYKARDCPRISKEFLAKEKLRMPEFVYRGEYENVFYARSGRLFTPEMIANMIDANVKAMEDFQSPHLDTEYTWQS